MQQKIDYLEKVVFTLREQNKNLKTQLAEFKSCTNCEDGYTEICRICGHDEELHGLMYLSSSRKLRPGCHGCINKISSSHTYVMTRCPQGCVPKHF